MNTVMYLGAAAAVWLVAMNIAGFAVCGIDKQRAKKKAWRIPERRIFMIAAAGGSLGVLAGMYRFRHKTKHPEFVIGIPVILICQILVACGIVYMLVK